MQTAKIQVTQGEALKLFRDYQTHLHYSTPIDDEIMRAYKLIAQGKLVINARASILAAGLAEDGLPKLAIARATAQFCFLTMNGQAGTCNFQDNNRGPTNRNRVVLDPGFGRQSWYSPGAPNYVRQKDAKAAMPIIPPQHRPKRGLDNYHVLWEAEWTPTPPRDPLLLRRIGGSDMWVVVAAWDLTEVERAAMSSRMHS